MIKKIKAMGLYSMTDRKGNRYLGGTVETLRKKGIIRDSLMDSDKFIIIDEGMNVTQYVNEKTAIENFQYYKED